MKLKLKGFLVLLLALITQVTFAQDRTVSGTVTDGNGLPVPVANVVVKGKSRSVQTDFDGKYKIQASASDVLVFSYIGMKTQEVKASSATVNVKLAAEANEIEGVVVTAIGQKRQKKALGYATTTVTSKDLTEVNNTNVFESLSGKIAGVDISAPAQVGASTKVVIRGFNTLGASSPLYIVDGSPITNSSSSSTGNTRSFDAGNGISDIDPNNIESMTVLKGAAASALYGSRAGQGVIIITTKSGKNNSKVSVEITNSVDMSEVARVPHFQNSFGEGWNGKSWSSYGGGINNTASNENGSWGPAFNGEIRPWGSVLNNAQQIKPYVALDNNFRDFFDKGLTYTNSIRLSGGGNNSNFSMTFSNANSDGVIPTNSDSFDRKSFGLNGGVTSDKLSFKASLNYVVKDQGAVNTGQGSDAGQGNTMTQELLQIPRDVSVVDLQDYHNNPYNNNSNYFTPYASNPYWVLNENKTFINGNRFYGNINVAYNFTKKLSLSYQIGGDHKLEKIKSYGAVVNYEPGSAQAVAGANAVVGGVTESSFDNTQFDTNLILNYSTNLNKDITLTPFIGFNTNERKNSGLVASITNLDIPYFYELSNSSVKPTVTQNDALRRSYAFFGSLETDYKNKLFLTLTGRNDWTSTLPKGANSYFYPSASLSGIAVDNSSSHLLNYLKLRVAYAKIANDTQPYQTLSSLNSGIAGLGFGTITLPIDGVNGYEFSSTLGNGALVPEMNKELEFGVESNLFSKRLSFDASIYNKKTNNLLAAIPIAGSTGFQFQTANILDVTNKGIELALNLIVLKSNDFKWDFNATYTKNKSNVDNILGGQEKLLLASDYGITFNAVKGQPLGVFEAVVPQRNSLGQYIVDPATGYYKVTDDEQNIGTSQRDFVMGFRNKFTYKNLALALSFDWKQGGKMYSYTKRLSEFTGNGIETAYNDRNPFIIPNSVVDNGDGTYSENTTPISLENITNFYNTSNNPGIEQGQVIDKTFVRMRDLSLTYNINSKMLQGTGLQSTSITFYGKNLFLWTPKENAYIDPELSTFGTSLTSEQGEFGANPSQRSYGVSLKLTF